MLNFQDVLMWTFRCGLVNCHDCLCCIETGRWQSFSISSVFVTSNMINSTTGNGQGVNRLSFSGIPQTMTPPPPVIWAVDTRQVRSIDSCSWESSDQATCWRLHRPVLVDLRPQNSQIAVPIVQELKLMWPPAVVDHPPHVLTCEMIFCSPLWALQQGSQSRQLQRTTNYVHGNDNCVGSPSSICPEPPKSLLTTAVRSRVIRVTMASLSAPTSLFASDLNHQQDFSVIFVAPFLLTSRDCCVWSSFRNSQTSSTISTEIMFFLEEH